MRTFRRGGTRQNQCSVFRPLRPPARFNDRYGRRVGDERGTVDPLLRPQLLAGEDRPISDRARLRPAPGSLTEDRLRARMRDSLDDQRVEDDLASLVDIAEAAPVQVGEGRPHFPLRPELDLQRRVAARQPQPGAPPEPDSALHHALLGQRVRRCHFQRAQGIREILAERSHHARLSDRLHVGKADAVSRQQARKRVDEDALNS